MNVACRIEADVKCLTVFVKGAVNQTLHVQQLKENVKSFLTSSFFATSNGVFLFRGDIIKSSIKKTLFFLLLSKNDMCSSY